jgi:hypothetical protein
MKRLHFCPLLRSYIRRHLERTRLLALTNNVETKPDSGDCVGSKNISMICIYGSALSK